MNVAQVYLFILSIGQKKNFPRKSLDSVKWINIFMQIKRKQ